MTPPLPPPKKKVSNLVSFFESTTTSPISITTTNSTPSSSSSNDSKSKYSRIDSPLSSPTLFKSNSISSTNSTTSQISTPTSSRIANLPKGLVSNHIRKFSLEPKVLVASSASSSGNRRVSVGSSNEVRESLGGMDWTSRPRETGELRSEARVRIESNKNITKSKSIGPSTSTSTTISNSPSTPASPLSPTTSNSTRYPPKSHIAPISNEKAKALGKKAFKPGRIAPLPPSTQTTAPTIVIPANVNTTADGSKTRMNIERGKKEKVIEEDSRVKEELVVKKKVDDKKLEKETKSTSSTTNPFVDRPISTNPISQVISSPSSPSTPISTTPLPPTKEMADEKLELSDPLSSASPPPPSYKENLPTQSRPAPRPVQLPTSSSPISSKSPSYPPSISYDPSTYSNSSKPRRPLLNHSSSSQVTTQTIRNLPAYEIFKSGAEKLILPDLDLYLDGIQFESFTNPCTKGILSVGERESWEEWCRGEKERQSWWGKLFHWNSRRSALSAEKQGNYVDLEAEQGLTGTTTRNQSEAEIRSSIFPPFHLLPKKLTVTDLKTNRLKVPLLGSLDSWIGIAVDGVLAGESSSIGLKFETVEIFRDLMQMFTLIIGARTTSNGVSTISTSWSHSIFVSLPRIISLDFVSAFGMAFLWLWVFTIIAGLAIYELYRFTGGWKGQVKELRDLGEGFDREGLLEPNGGEYCGEKKKRFTWRNSKGYKTFITFIATSLYLPLSKISISTLAWSNDLWIVPDPYTITDEFPNPAPLGPPSDYYDTLDFCYRTTMLKPKGLQNLNWAWLILPVSILTVLVLTIWLPWRIHKVVQAAAPKVDPYTELGEKRKDSPAEYVRLLAVDQSPYSFLYQAYRRSWASFKSIYMLVKLVNILLIVLIDKDNCIFRTHTTSSLLIIRQASLLGFMTLFLLADTISKPFIDMISNNSDRVSRIGFVVLALIGLLVALDVPGKAKLSGAVTIGVGVISYLFNMYFSLIGTSFAMSYVKRLQYRLDFSIDIFSPHLDLAKHVSRRVWQETWSCLLLTAEFKMPVTERLIFTDNPNLPPYLLGFTGTQGERHVENLKVLRGIGLEAYSRAMKDRSLPEDCRIIQVRTTIHQYFVGPDIVWHPPHSQLSPKITSFFGRLDVYPFPFVAVFRYDQDSTPIHITDIDDLELLIRQNETTGVRDSRKVRLALRSLENQEIFAPHSVINLTSRRGGVEFETRVNYRVARLTICRNSALCWRGYNFSSGFEVKLSYNDGEGQEADGEVRHGQHLVLTAEDIGITSDFRLTSTLAKLLRHNRDIIETRLPIIDDTLALHREYFYNQVQWKNFTLSPSFLFDVVANDTLSIDELTDVLKSTEKDSKVQGITENYSGTMIYLHERRDMVMRSRISQWWYILFDDLWRSNRADISLIQNQPAAFSPHYRTSICYQPISRPRLEEFLKEHSLWCDGKKGFFNSGFLNRIYFYLNEITFSSTSRAIPIHIGFSPRRLKFDHLEYVVPQRSSKPKALTTGALDPNQSYAFSTTSHSYSDAQEEGTNHDSNVIRARPAFTFEEIFDAPKLRWQDGKLNYIKDFAKDRVVGTALVWLGVQPFSHDHRAHKDQGISFDLRGGKEGEGWKLPRNLKSREEKGDEIVF